MSNSRSTSIRHVPVPLNTVNTKLIPIPNTKSIDIGTYLTSVSTSYYGTVGSGRLGSFSDHFLAAEFRPEVQTNLPELAGIGENCAGIEKSCTGTDSDFNGSSRRNDRPGARLFVIELLCCQNNDTTNTYTIRIEIW
ncbi:unnamed protein product [Adineta ricciae]|uniref:Uncharacterized protein n=1 Tax=Adineta ricciae TaxID=249248 RepID=A0A814UN84_ADIRI|nr:unnamed protein product [Adineta ricciae]